MAAARGSRRGVCEGVGGFAAEGGGDGIELGREGGLVDVDADADDGVAERGGLWRRRRGWRRCR